MTIQEKDIYLNHWRKLAENELDWGDSTEWADSDFEKLAELIFTKTGTMFSVTTLKRVWGRVRYDSSPNAATLDALAKFVDFSNRRTFKNSVHQPQKTGVVAARPPHKKNFALIWKLALAAIIIGVVVALAYKPDSRPVKIASNAPVKFDSRKVTDNLPNSVVFNYDASGLGVDSIVLQQSWDASRNEKIPASLKEHTSIYYYPGYFNAKLMINGKILKESPVFIKTKGWIGIIEKRPTPTYLNANDIFLPGTLGVSNKTLAQKTGSTVFNDQLVIFSNVREFNGSNGGDFTLETTLRNTSKPDESSCRKVIVYILGKQNTIIIPLADKGCISALSMYTSSEWINGKDRDLSAFGCDFTAFQNIKCSVKDMKLEVNLNGKQIFTAPITQTIGDIVGISFGFEGAGEIKSVKLGNSTQTVLNDNF
jgi:hypothetical protein